MNESDLMTWWFGWWFGWGFLFFLWSFKYWWSKRYDETPRPTPSPAPVPAYIPPAKVSQVSENVKSKNFLRTVGGLFAKPPPQYFDKDGKQINVSYEPVPIPPPPVPESVLAPEPIPLNPPVHNTLKVQGYCHKCRQRQPLHNVEYKDYSQKSGRVVRYAIGYCDVCLTKSTNISTNIVK